MGHLGQGSEPCPGLGPGSLHPRGFSRIRAHSGPAAVWPGPPEATLLWRLPPSLPPGPRLLKAPAQGWSELRQIPLPLLPNIPRTCPQLWKPAPSGAQGLLPYSPALHLPTASKVPRHPTSRTEPAPFAPACPAAQRPPDLSQAGAPQASLSHGSRQMPPDQHLAQPVGEPLPPCLLPLPWKPLGCVSEKYEAQMLSRNSLFSLRIAPVGQRWVRRPLKDGEQG